MKDKDSIVLLDNELYSLVGCLAAAVVPIISWTVIA